MAKRKSKSARSRKSKERQANTVTSLPRRASDSTPDLEQISGYLQAAKEMAKQGDLPGAKAKLALVLEADPALVPALEFAAWVHMASKEYVAARVHLQRLTEINPSNPKYYNDLAASLLMGGDPAGAVSALRQALRLEPENVLYLGNLGKALAMIKQYEEAQKHLAKAVQLCQDDKRQALMEALQMCREAMFEAVANGELSGETVADEQLMSNDLMEVLPNSKVNPSPSKNLPPSSKAEEKTPSKPEPTPAAMEPVTERAEAPKMLPKQAELGKAPRTLNILFVQESPCIRNYKMAVALRARGHQVSLAYTTARLSQMYPGLDDGVYNQCIQIGHNRQLWDLCGDYDVVHCHNEPDMLTVVALGGKTPVVHDTHDLISLRQPGDKNIEFFEGLANRAAQGRVYTTPYQRETAAALHGVAGPGLVLYNYVSQGDLPSHYLSKLSEKDGQTHVVYEGGIGGNTHRDFKELFWELAEQGLRLHIYPNRLTPELQALFQGRPNIHLHEPVSPHNIIGEMSQYDIGIIPFNLVKGNRRFLDTTIANKLFEYLAAGLPVIASPLKSYVDYFARNPVGFTFDSAQQVMELLPQLGRMSREIDFGQHIFTYEGQIEKLESFYYGLLDQLAQARPGAPPEVRPQPARPEDPPSAEPLSRLLAWLEQNGWEGWDPYDLQDYLIQQAKAGRPCPPQEQQALLEEDMRSPLELRRRLGFKKRIIPKGLGLLAAAHTRLYKAGHGEEHLQEAKRLAQWLLANPSKGYKNLCWGYPFDWQSVIFIPKDTPSVVVSTAAGEGLWELFSATRDRKYLDACRSICRFITQDLRIDDLGANGVCFSYTPIDDYHVHNANLLAAEFLARVGKECEEKEWLELAERAARYAVSEQNPDGSIFYWGQVQDHYAPRKLDIYHSGFEIRCLHKLAGLLESDELKRAYQAYLKFFLANYLLSDGTPKLTPQRPYPVNIHGAAEAVLLLAALSPQHPELLELAERSLAWTVRHMQHREGWFVHLWAPQGRVEIPHLRWGQAWMLRALAEMETAKRIASGKWGYRSQGDPGPGRKAKAALAGDLDEQLAMIQALAQDYQQVGGGRVPAHVVQMLAQLIPGGENQDNLGRAAQALASPQSWDDLKQDLMEPVTEEAQLSNPDSETEPAGLPADHVLDIEQVQISMPDTQGAAYGSRDWAERLFKGAKGDPWGHDWRASQQVRYQKALELLSRHVKPQEVARLLDVGCALGHFTKMLKGMFKSATVTGVDISPEAVAKCAHLHPEVEFREASLPSLQGLAPGEFDLVSALEVIFYVAPEQIQAAFARLRELMKPGAWLLISCYMYRPPFRTPQEFQSALERHFKVVDMELRHHGVYSQFEGMIRNSLEQTANIAQHVGANASQAAERFIRGGVNLLGDIDLLEFLNGYGKNSQGEESLSHAIVLAKKL